MSLLENIYQNIPSALIYWSTFSISIFISWIYQKYRIYINPNGEVIVRPMTRTTQRLFMMIIIIIPALLIGLRDFSVGTDTQNYVNGYFSSYSMIQSDTNMSNLIFNIIRYLTSIVSGGKSPSFFLFFLVLITLYIFIEGLNKWLGKLSIPIALFIYYALFGLQLVNQSRQLLSMSIIFFAIPYLIENKKNKYLVLVILSGMIHFTGLIGVFFMLLYFRENKYYSIKVRITRLILIISPILIVPVLNIMSIFLPDKYYNYIAIAGVGEGGLGWLITIFPVIVPIFLLKKYIDSYETKYLTRITLLTFPLRIMGYFSYYIARLTHFSMLYLVILIPLIIFNSKGTKYHNIISIFSIGIFALYFIIQYMGINAADFFPYILKN